MTAAPPTQPTEPTGTAGLGAAWDDVDAVVAQASDRIRFTHPDVHLSISPAATELTWRGPDSDDPAGPVRDWDWLSAPDTTGLVELERLAVSRTAAAADEVVRLLTRRAHQALALNAVHEVGEWLKLNGVRPFGPHTPIRDRLTGQVVPGGVDDGPQGNGAVLLELAYDAHLPEAAPTVPAPTPTAGALEWLCQCLAACRFSDAFTYRPGSRVEITPGGPRLVVDDLLDARTGARTTATLDRRWSSSVLEAATALHGAAPESLAWNVLARQVARDVHRTLVIFEIHEIGEHLLVDGSRPLDPHLSSEQVRAGASPLGADGAGPVRVVLTYLPSPDDAAPTLAGCR